MHYAGAIAVSNIQECRRRHFYELDAYGGSKCAFIRSSPGKSLMVQFSHWRHLHKSLDYRWMAAHGRACLNTHEAPSAASLETARGDDDVHYLDKAAPR